MAITIHRVRAGVGVRDTGLRVRTPVRIGQRHGTTAVDIIPAIGAANQPGLYGVATAFRVCSRVETREVRGVLLT